MRRVRPRGYQLETNGGSKRLKRPGFQHFAKGVQASLRLNNWSDNAEIIRNKKFDNISDSDSENGSCQKLNYKVNLELEKISVHSFKSLSDSESELPFTIPVITSNGSYDSISGSEKVTMVTSLPRLPRVTNDLISEESGGFLFARRFSLPEDRVELERNEIECSSTFNNCACCS